MGLALRATPRHTGALDSALILGPSFTARALANRSAMGPEARIDT
jgi:hypothetical protein